MDDNSTFSIRLSHLLEMIIGNEEDIMKRRRMFEVFSFYGTSSQGYVEYIHTGSRAEGFDLEGSDTDVMRVCLNINDVDSITGDTSDNTLVHLNIRYSLESPGSVFLEVLNLHSWSQTSLSTDCVTQAIVPFCHYTLLSSSLLCETFVSLFNALNPLRAEINGPCLTHVDENDLAFAHNHRLWPKVATEWITRHRPHEWPSPSLVSRIVQEGCHLVAVGDGHSCQSDFLWRISFACAEMKLVRSLNFVQFKTYGLLKIVLNDIFKKYQTKDEPLLCSYYMKTIMFYAVENSPTCLWIDRNLFRCFWMCLNMLIDCVSKGYLANYFIPANNLFRKRLCGRNRRRLLSILQRFRNKGADCFYESETLRSVILKPSLTVNREAFFDKILLNHVSCYDLNITDTDIHRVFKMLLHSNVDIDIYISLNELRKVLTTTASECFYTRISGDNKNIYLNYRQCRKYLTFNTNIDASSGWLILASYHYTIGQYRQTLELCRHVMSSVSPSTMYASKILQPQYYIQRWCGRGIQFHIKTKTAFMATVDIGLYNICPEELRREMNADGRGIAFFLPLSYASFLSCLCYHHIKDRDNMQDAIDDLKAYILFDNEFFPAYNTQFNLLRACYRIVG